MGSERTNRGATAPSGEALAWVTALATAFKNIAIYPGTHPRVEGAAADFVGRLTRGGGRHVWHVLNLSGNEFSLGEATIPTDSGIAAWLAQRFREAGLRGLEFATDCSIADVLQVAATLTRCRARTGKTFESLWPGDHERVRPRYLVFEGHHQNATNQPSGGASADGAPNSSGEVHEQRLSAAGNDVHSPRLVSLLNEVTASPAVQERLRAIERCGAEVPDSELREVDLMAAIGELLPADVSSDAQQVADAVQEILTRVETELRELVRRKAKVKGADLLRLALGVARKYFHTEAPQQTQRRDLPSGRPEDASIVADLDLLLSELESLPDDTGLQLPPPDQLAANAPAMGEELLGIYLHTLACHDNPNTATALEAPLTQLLTNNGARLRDMLDAYIKPKSGEPPLGTAGRLRLIKFLADAGLATLAREQNYIDAEYLTRGFPEALPLAARVLGEDAPGRAILRQALEALAPVLAIGGIEAATKAGVLTDPVVVERLVAVGGPVVLPLLIAAGTSNSLLIRKILLDYARTLPLPKAEAAVCRALRNIELVPREYVQNLLIAASQKRLDTTLRTASGQLLRRAIEHADGRLEPEAMLVAIDDLRHVPGPETIALLTQLAKTGRFTRFSSHARAIRRQARATLDDLSAKGNA